MCFGHATFLGGRRDSLQCLAPTELADGLALAVHKRFPRITAELAPTTRVPRSPDWLPGDSAMGANNSNAISVAVLRCRLLGISLCGGAPSGILAAFAARRRQESPFFRLRCQLWPPGDVSSAVSQKFRGTSAVRAILLGVLVALALPASAVAARGSLFPPGSHPVVPTGNSGADQYVESVPTAVGNRSSSAVSSGESSGASRSSATGPVPQSTQDALINNGLDGVRTLEFARATAPKRERPAPSKTRLPAHRRSGARQDSAVGGSAGGGSAGGGSAGVGSAGGGGSAAGTGSSPTATILKSVTGFAQGAGGPVLPAILIVSLLGAGAVALRRTRSG